MATAFNVNIVMDGTIPSAQDLFLGNVVCLLQTLPTRYRSRTLSYYDHVLIGRYHPRRFDLFTVIKVKNPVSIRLFSPCFKDKKTKKPLDSHVKQSIYDQCPQGDPFRTL